MEDPQRLVKLSKILKSKYGEDCIKIGQEIQSRKIIKTGLAVFDKYIALSPGQWQVFYGPQASGKSTLAFKIIGKLQRNEDLLCLVVDIENSFNSDWAVKQGMDLDKTIYIAVRDNIEEYMQIIIEVLNTKEIGIVLVDSIHASATKAQVEKREEDISKEETYALLAKKIGQFLTVATPKLAKSNAIGFLIGQARSKITPTGGGGLDLSGGHALKHFSTNILRIYKSFDKTTKTDDSWIINIILEKTRSEHEGKHFSLKFVVGTGIDELYSNVAYARSSGIVTSKGAWIYFGEKKYLGFEKFFEALETDKDLYDSLLSAITATSPTKVGVADEIISEEIEDV